MRVTFLGTGTSHGIPVIACSCRVCSSKNPKNQRWRSSVLIESGSDSAVIDTPQEFRLQALRSGITSLTSVCYTHAHADHIFGIDDLRVFSKEKKLQVYGDEETISVIAETFGYIFSGRNSGGGIPSLELHNIAEKAPYIGEHRVMHIPVQHGCRTITGYRVGPFGYITDCSGLPEQSIEMLKGLDVLVIGALRYRTHPTHWNVQQALEMAETLSPRLAYFTHMCHDIDHDQLESMLPDGISPAYDGLTLEL